MMTPRALRRSFRAHPVSSSGLVVALLLCVLSGPVAAQDLTPQQQRARQHRAMLKDLGIQVARPVLTDSTDVKRSLDVVYAAYGERKLHADLFTPTSVNGPVAAIVLVHGGGWLKGDKSKFHPLGEALALRGYVVAVIEYRLGGEAKFPAAIHDCNAAVRWLRARSQELGIDPDRIAAVGGSAGGHLVGLMASAPHVKELQGAGGHESQSNAIQAAVVMAGPMQMTTGSVAERSRKQPQQSNANRWIGQTVDEAPELYRLAAPYTHLSENTPPMLFMAGEHDQPARNLPTRERLAYLGVRTEVRAYRYGLHGCWNQSPWFEPMVQDIDTFLRSVWGPPGGVPANRPLPAERGAEWTMTGIRVPVASAENGSISIPRLNNRIRRALIEENGAELKLVPGVRRWPVKLPKPPGGATVLIETIEPPHVPVIPEIVSAETDGVITLHGYQAVTHGELLRYEPQPHKNTVGYWARADDWCEWHLYCERPGLYGVRILQGCGKGQGGSEVALELGSEELTFTVEDTGHFQNFKMRDIGSVAIKDSGVLTLKLIPRRKAAQAVMDVRRIELVPQAAATR